MVFIGREERGSGWKNNELEWEADIETIEYGAEWLSAVFNHSLCLC